MNLVFVSPTRGGRAQRSGIFPALLLIVLSVGVEAAAPPPKLNLLTPQWLERGKTTEVIFEGENLTGLTRFSFSGETGINAVVGGSAKKEIQLESSASGLFSTEGVNDPKKLLARIAVPSEVALGHYEVRLVTPSGLSNPLQFHLSDFPEADKPAPTNSFDKPMLVELPIGISGIIREMGEIDWFRFHARKGQRLLFDVDASRSGSPLDPSLALFSAAGKELLRSEDVNVFDPFIDWVVLEDGDYLIQLRDFRYQGGGNFKYHLVAGEVPFLDYIFPFGGQRGQPVQLALKGRNLGDQTNMLLRVGPSAPLGMQGVRARAPRGMSNERSFEVSEFPEFMEGTNAGTTNVLMLPLNINGRLAEAGETDTFIVKAESGQRFVFEVMASRFGSRLDALLTLTGTNDTVLQRNDDAVGADARIDYTFTSSGTFRLTIRDLLDRGGDDFGYRIAIRPPAKPDFSARILVDSVRVHRGSCVVVPVDVARNGFSGPVQITGEKLPPGLTCPPILIPGDASSGRVEIEAAADAPTDSFTMRLTALGVIEGKRVSRPVQAMAGERPARESWITVLEKSPFAIEWISLNGEVEQNQSTTLLAMARRQDGFTGDIKISAEGFSAGKEPITKSFEVQPVTLTTNATRGEFKLKAKSDSETGTRHVYLKGEATADGQTVTEYSEPIPFTVTEFPFTLANSLPRLALTALPKGSESAAGEAEFSVKAARRGLFTEEINLALEGLPEGIVATTTNLPRGATEVPFKLTTTEKAKPGTTNTFTVVGTSTVNGRTFTHRTPGVALIVNAPAEATPPATAAK